MVSRQYGIWSKVSWFKIHISNPRNKEMQKNLNLKIKYESFRPFAPSILEDVNSWFDLDCKSPYMLLVDNVKKSKLLKTKLKNHGY